MSIETKIIKGRTLEGIIFDGTYDHAVEIGRFLRTGFAIQTKAGETWITLAEGKTNVRKGDFIYVDDQGLLRVLFRDTLLSFWDTVPGLTWRDRLRLRLIQGVVGR